MKLQEKINIIIEKHPFADSLNDKLIEEFNAVVSTGYMRGFVDKDLRYNNIKFTNIIGNKVPVLENNDASSKIVGDWVDNIVRVNYHRRDAEKVSYRLDMWFAQYNKGDYAQSHGHIPYAIFSFVYFVKCPPGSSPLVFTTSGKKIKAEEGKLVLFPSIATHHVPKNRCENRIVLAGNLKFL